ncbi:hypothetical protein GCM10023317_76950 [Actinopolymorpha pittospori]
MLDGRRECTDQLTRRENDRGGEKTEDDDENTEGHDMSGTRPPEQPQERPPPS